MTKHLTILKSISTKPDPEHTLILAYMYYSDKTNRNNNQYRFEVRVEKDEDLKKEIESNKTKCVEEWHWPGIPDMVCKYAKRSARAMAAKWLDYRMKKAVPWENFKKEISIPWKDKGWLSEGYTSPGKDDLIDLKTLTKEQALALKQMSHCSTRAESTKKDYLGQGKL